MSTNPDNYFSPEYVPDDFVFVELSRMNSKATKALIHHWIHHGNRNCEPFRFKDQSPKVLFKKYNRSASQKPFKSDEYISLDSSNAEHTHREQGPPSANEESDNDPTPKPKKRKQSPEDPNDDLPMMKIGPLKKGARKLPEPKKKSAPKTSDDKPTPKLKPLSYKPVAEEEPLFDLNDKQPIALTGPLANSFSESNRYCFLRTLSKILPYQKLIQDIRTLPKGAMTRQEGQTVTAWSSWDRESHCIPSYLHLNEVIYNKFLTWMMEEPYRYGQGKLFKRTSAEHVAIAIGMTLRDIHL
jgi:hypothetical protein